MKRKWSNRPMNQLMFEIRDHHIANKIVKLIKKYFINFEKIMKRLQLTVLKCSKKNRNIWTITVYILNDFKRVHSKIYYDCSASTQENFRVADLMIRKIKLIKNFQINLSFDDDFVKSSSITASRIDIIKINISISLIRAVVLVISRKTSQAKKN